MKHYSLLVLAAALVACDAKTPEISDADIAAVHSQVLTLDTHIDVPLTYMTEVDPGQQTNLQGDLPDIETGQLDAAFFIVYTPQGDLTEEGYDRAKQVAETRMASIQAMSKNYFNRVALAKTAQEVRDIVKDGRHAVLIGMENG